MNSILKRVVLGFAAGAISVLIFHQGMVMILHYLDLPGLGGPLPYSTLPVPPFGVPRIANLCFWGGLWGALFGAVWRGSSGLTWLAGLVLGIAAALTGLLVVPWIKGLPIGGGWLLTSWIRSFLINGAWGLGVGLLLTAIYRRTPSTMGRYA